MARPLPWPWPSTEGLGTPTPWLGPVTLEALLLAPVAGVLAPLLGQSHKGSARQPPGPRLQPKGNQGHAPGSTPRLQGPAPHWRCSETRPRLGLVAAGAPPPIRGPGVSSIGRPGGLGDTAPCWVGLGPTPGLVLRLPGPIPTPGILRTPPPGSVQWQPGTKAGWKGPWPRPLFLFGGGQGPFPSLGGPEPHLRFGPAVTRTLPRLACGTLDPAPWLG